MLGHLGWTIGLDLFRLRLRYKISICLFRGEGKTHTWISSTFAGSIVSHSPNIGIVWEVFCHFCKIILPSIDLLSRSRRIYRLCRGRPMTSLCTVGSWEEKIIWLSSEGGHNWYTTDLGDGGIKRKNVGDSGERPGDKALYISGSDFGRMGWACQLPASNQSRIDRRNWGGHQGSLVLQRTYVASPTHASYIPYISNRHQELGAKTMAH